MAGRSSAGPTIPDAVQEEKSCAYQRSDSPRRSNAAFGCRPARRRISEIRSADRVGCLEAGNAQTAAPQVGATGSLIGNLILAIRLLFDALSGSTSQEACPPRVLVTSVPARFAANSRLVLRATRLTIRPRTSLFPSSEPWFVGRYLHLSRNALAVAVLNLRECERLERRNIEESLGAR